MFAKSSSSAHPFGGGAQGGYPIQVTGGSGAARGGPAHGGNMFAKTIARGGKGLLPPQQGSNPGPGGTGTTDVGGTGHAHPHGQRARGGSTSFQGSPLKRAKKLFTHWGLGHPLGGGGSTYS